MKTLTLIMGLLLYFPLSGHPQQAERNFIPMIGDNAPHFVAESTQGTINFPGDFGKNWKIIFSHPQDFTPVCSSEILELASMQREFENLDARLIVISTDKLETHFSWKEAMEEIDFKGRGKRKIYFPFVDDNDYSISSLYGMHHPNAKRGTNIRGVFYVDRNDKIRAIQYYPNEVGRSTDEILRTLLALQMSDDNFDYKIPANWQPGEPLMVGHTNPQMIENMQLESPIYFQYSWFMIYWKNNESNGE